MVSHFRQGNFRLGGKGRGIPRRPQPIALRRTRPPRRVDLYGDDSLVVYNDSIDLTIASIAAMAWASSDRPSFGQHFGLC